MRYSPGFWRLPDDARTLPHLNSLLPHLIEEVSRVLTLGQRPTFPFFLFPPFRPLCPFFPRVGTVRASFSNPWLTHETHLFGNAPPPFFLMGLLLSSFPSAISGIFCLLPRDFQIFVFPRDSLSGLDPALFCILLSCFLSFMLLLMEQMQMDFLPSFGVAAPTLLFI